MKYLTPIIIFICFYVSTSASTLTEKGILDSLLHEYYDKSENTIVGLLDTQVLNKIITRANEINATEASLEAKFLKGIYYYKHEQFLHGLLYLQTSLEEVNESKNQFLKADILNYIGNINFYLGRLEEGKKNLQECIQISKKEAELTQMYNCMGNLANIYMKQNKKIEGLQIYLDLYEQKDNITSQNFLHSISNSLGFAYLELNQANKALPYLEHSSKLATNTNNPKDVAIATGNLAYCHFLMKDFPKAYEYYHSSLKLSKNYPSVTYVTYKDLSDTYLADNQAIKALEYLSKHHALKDSVQGTKIQEQISAMQVKHQTALQQQEIKELNQDNQIKRQQLAMAVGFVLISLAVIGWLVSNNSRKKQKVEVQQLKIENANKELALKNKEIEFKKQDITNLALEINKKHEFVDQLLQRLGTFKSNIPSSHQKNWHSLENFVRENAQLNQEKRIFQKNVEQVNQAFFENLKENYPKLTKGEKELCGYLRLNLSNKEIATLRNTSMEAVKMGRYRLRKKLNLTPKEDVVELLQQF